MTDKNQQDPTEQAKQTEDVALPDSIKQETQQDETIRTDDSHMWEDPFPNDISHGGVLLAEDIRDYIDKGLLIDKKDFNEADLKGASYSLTPDGQGAWYYDKRGNCRNVEVSESGGRKHYIVPENSIVYIKIKESLRIPYYMIGRHNLKIDYVYQGLLLGTGPQVDPGYEGNLIIPLHNLTNHDVQIHVGQSFVSIDFTKTTPLRMGYYPQTDAEFRLKFPEKKQIQLSKVRKRTTLHDYLNGHSPRSSMMGIVDEVKKISKARTIWDWTLLGIIIAVTGSIIGFNHSDYKDLNDRLFSMSTSISECKLEYGNLTNGVREIHDKISNLEASIKSSIDSNLVSPESLSKTNVSHITLKVGVEK